MARLISGPRMFLCEVQVRQVQSATLGAMASQADLWQMVGERSGAMPSWEHH